MSEPLNRALQAMSDELAEAEHAVDLALARRANIAEVLDRMRDLLPDGYPPGSRSTVALNTAVRDTPKKTPAVRKLKKPCPECDREFETAIALGLHRRDDHGVVRQGGKPIEGPADPETGEAAALAEMTIPLTDDDFLLNVGREATREVLTCLDCDYTCDADDRTMLAAHTHTAHSRAPTFAERQPETRPVEPGRARSKTAGLIPTAARR